MQPTEHPLAALKPSVVSLRGFKTALLTTYRRNGQGVGTPVGIIVVGDTVYFATRHTTGKVKRLRHTPRATLAPCTRGGRPTGPAIDCIARPLTGAEAAPVEKLFFGSLWGQLWLRLYRLFRPRDRWIVYAVTVVPELSEQDGAH